MRRVRAVSNGIRDRNGYNYNRVARRQVETTVRDRERTRKIQEKLTTYRRCMSIWRRRSEITVLREDRGLFEDRHAPSERQTLDYLRAWLTARELAIQEYSNNDPSRKQPKIDKWLGPRPEKRRDKG